MATYSSKYEFILDDMVKYLVLHPTKLSRINSDGRVNSIQNQDEVIANLQQIEKFQSLIFVPEARNWFDFSITDVKHGGIPVNIKISDFSNSSADNLSSKQGMAFALTGNAQVSNSWPQFNEQLVNELRRGYDYYYLIVNKVDTSDCYWTSLKRIETLTSNGNNLPFQCNWSINRTPSNRDEEAATRYILQVYKESWDKKISGYPKNLKEILERKDIFKPDTK